MRQLIADVEGASVSCPDCGDTLIVRVTEIDTRRGATWTADGSILIGKSSDVQTLDVELTCAQGHGTFEVPDVEDYL